MCVRHAHVLVPVYVRFPSSGWFVVECPPRRVKLNTDGPPRPTSFALDTMGKPVVVEKTAEHSEVPVAVGLVPAHDVGIVDVRGEDGPRRPESRCGAPTGDQLQLRVAGTEPEVLSSNDHESRHDGMANIE